jgi:putative endonuclease
MSGFFYIMASGPYKTIYAGVTNDLLRRTQEHKEGKGGYFTKKYKINQLVFYESYENITEAIAREKQIKKWERSWKLELIETMNPEWRDLSEDWTFQAAQTRGDGSPLMRG